MGYSAHWVKKLQTTEVRSIEPVAQTSADCCVSTAADYIMKYSWKRKPAKSEDCIVSHSAKISKMFSLYILLCRNGNKSTNTWCNNSCVWFDLFYGWFACLAKISYKRPYIAVNGFSFIISHLWVVKLFYKGWISCQLLYYIALVLLILQLCPNLRLGNAGLNPSKMLLVIRTIETFMLWYWYLFKQIIVILIYTNQTKIEEQLLPWVTRNDL